MKVSNTINGKSWMSCLVYMYFLATQTTRITSRSVGFQCDLIESQACIAKCMTEASVVVADSTHAGEPVTEVEDSEATCETIEESPLSDFESENGDSSYEEDPIEL